MEDDETLDSIDVTSLASEIASGLSPEIVDPPEASEETKVETAPAAETPPAPAPSPETSVVAGQNSVGKDLPKSWKKDMAPHWAKLPPEVHDYVYEREANVMRGFQQYQQGHDSWQAVIKPFAPIFQQHPDVQPVQLLQGLMQTHLKLLNPSLPVAEKTRLAKQIMADYQIPLDGAAAEADPSQAPLLAELNSLRAELGQLKQHWTTREQEAHNARVKEQENLIEAFANDPKNPYFKEVENDIHRFVMTGVATDIATAYELACWSNPAVRAKMIAAQQSPNPSAVTAPVAKKFVNIDSDTPPASRTRKGKSIEATIDSIVSSHFPKH